MINPVSLQLFIKATMAYRRTPASIAGKLENKAI
jgi:hypothetical protein